ncbi:MAG: hypothetical protein WCJ64_12745, partial [Rhodospirillaceae bacterium]
LDLFSFFRRHRGTMGLRHNYSLTAGTGCGSQGCSVTGGFIDKIYQIVSKYFLENHPNIKRMSGWYLAVLQVN